MVPTMLLPRLVALREQSVGTQMLATMVVMGDAVSIRAHQKGGPDDQETPVD